MLQVLDWAVENGIELALAYTFPQFLAQQTGKDPNTNQQHKIDHIQQG
jgi:hypothetical protein